jgi:hypothetical protein
VNITLSADKEIIEKVRKYAAQRGTSLNQIIRDYLEQLTNLSDIDKYADEFAKLAVEKGGASPSDFVFDREEAHTRKDSAA